MSVGGVLVVVCVGGIIAVGTVVPKMQESWQRIHCTDNLSQLARTYVVAKQSDTNAKPVSGPALWLCRYGAEIKRGDERYFVCTDDPLTTWPEPFEARKQYDHVDLTHVPRSICSYAGRDFDKFPIDPVRPTEEPIGACVHHAGGAVVAFADGDVRWLTLDKLGIDSDDDKIVGPNSKSPVLRVLRYGDGSVR